ncbi:LysR family transcriptional regulator [Janthinobacterium agaricidamnosum]|uniref:Bacterial regulatory helix-turn-helix, lysR family protein n=1 Tax=Janthinobacterium agaricidamnosum NBRC 102515 = DSM 9628 TaxID=1349767 RepID=W0VAI9_9BURK|nr:LysR family transcriptional regulator [Janthinobacterium agaricidamnosum]CDG84287.1 bacterial regulatory helix-turn-helix, lysR family protein [Janthinobacterium agaricidamnosum NBRC 102515 = DSM 9628]
MIDMKGADLALLVSLDVLLEEANVTKAALRLNISQPALSAQLARLRELLGDPLLVPSESGRGMVPTARAELLRTPLHDALRGLEKTVREPPVFDPASAQRTFSVAANDNATVVLGLGLARRFEAVNSAGLRLAFRSADPQQVVGQMERGEVDVILAGSRFLPDALKTRTLLNDVFMLAQRKGHPRGAGAPDLAAYCDLQHVIVSNSGGFHGLIDERLALLGMRRRVALSVSNYNLVPLILARTDYVCALPQCLLRRFSDTLDVFPLPLADLDFTLSLAWHPRSDNDPGHRWLREQLVVEAGEHIPPQNRG